MANMLEIRSIISQAIGRRFLLSLSYGGYERIVEPVVHGIRSGTEHLLAIQVGGQSESGNIPGWRSLNVAELLEVTPLGASYEVTVRHLVDTSDWDHIFAKVAAP